MKMGKLIICWFRVFLSYTKDLTIKIETCLYKPSLNFKVFPFEFSPFSYIVNQAHFSNFMSWFISNINQGIIEVETDPLKNDKKA